jgi:hypothetical protein
MNNKGIYYLTSPTCFSLFALLQGYHLILQEGQENSYRFDYSVRIKRNNNVMFVVLMIHEYVILLVVLFDDLRN